MGVQRENRKLNWSMLHDLQAGCLTHASRPQAQALYSKDSFENCGAQKRGYSERLARKMKNNKDSIQYLWWVKQYSNNKQQLKLLDAAHPLSLTIKHFHPTEQDMGTRFSWSHQLPRTTGQACIWKRIC